MKDQFKNKPTKEAVSAYEKELTRLLSGHNVIISIELMDSPTILTSSHHNTPAITEYYWIKTIKVKMPSEEFETDHLFSEYMPRQDYLDLKCAWSDAFSLQNEIYQKLRKFKVLKVGSDDPYWNLWRFV